MSNLKKVEQEDVSSEFNSLIIEEILDRFMPMLEKQLPKAEKALFEQISGKNDGIHKTVIIKAKDDKVFALVYDDSKITVQCEEDPIDVLNSSELITGLIRDGLSKK